MLFRSVNNSDQRLVAVRLQRHHAWNEFHTTNGASNLFHETDTSRVEWQCRLCCIQFAGQSSTVTSTSYGELPGAVRPRTVSATPACTDRRSTGRTLPDRRSGRCRRANAAARCCRSSGRHDHPPQGTHAVTSASGIAVNACAPSGSAIQVTTPCTDSRAGPISAGSSPTTLDSVRKTVHNFLHAPSEKSNPKH